MIAAVEAAHRPRRDQRGPGHHLRPDRRRALLRQGLRLVDRQRQLHARTVEPRREHRSERQPRRRGRRTSPLPLRPRWDRRATAASTCTVSSCRRSGIWTGSTTSTLRGHRAELQRDRSRDAARGEPGRARAQGALRRHDGLRGAALAAARQAEHRVGQDGAVPHHRPVQSADARALDAAEPRGVAHRALVGARHLVVLRRGSARGRAPRGRRQPRRLRAGRPRPLRHALHGLAGVRQDLRALGARRRGRRASPARTGRRTAGTR